MSRGPGYIERAIARIVRNDRRHDWVVDITVEDVAQALVVRDDRDVFEWRGDEKSRVLRGVQVSILYAMHSYVKRHPAYMLAGGKGRTPLHLIRKGDEAVLQREWDEERRWRKRHPDD
jgi:hypothetical protein